MWVMGRRAGDLVSRQLLSALRACGDDPDQRETAVENILQFCPAVHHDQVRRALEERDPVRLLISVGNDAALPLVFKVFQELLVLSMFEDCLVEAWLSARVNHAGLSNRRLVGLFSLADRERLRAAADPIPNGSSFRLYRGVAGTGRGRRVRGLAWTSDLERARWFAQRFPLPNPAVFTAEVERSDVLFYSDDRNESEFVIWPPQRPKLLERLESKYERRAA